MIPFLKQLSLCLMLGAAPIAAAAQNNSTTLTATDMRILAQDLLNAGRPADAGSILDALLSRDPMDSAALILAAQVALDRNDAAMAADFAQRAFRAATDDTSRYVAARLAARSQAELSRDTRAQIWLRRARQFAPDAESADSVAQDYAFIRDRNPLAVSLSFGVRPSSNINNGSRSDTATIGQFETILSESAKPLSGIAFDASGTLRYRLRQSERSATFAEVDFKTTTYALSKQSKDALQRDIEAAAESVLGDDDLPRDGGDFAYSVLSASLIERRILRDDMAPTTFSLRAGQSWYGGDRYQTFVGAGVAQTFPVGRAEQFRLEADVQKDFAENAFRDAVSYSAAAGYSRALEGGHVVSGSLSGRLSQSDDTERDYRSIAVGFGFDAGQPLFNTRFGFGVRLEERKFDESIYATGIRRDRTISGQVTAVLDNVEYYGFTPVASLSLGRTFSEAERFDTQYGNIGFDFQSAF